VGRGHVLLALAAAGAALAGCSREDEAGLPDACRAGEDAVRTALAGAPGRVAIEEGTPLSACLTRSSDAADVQQVGSTYVAAAADLAADAKARPEGPTALRLGYLIGSVRRGSARTQGIHSELVRRMEQELLGVNTRSEAFRRGERAGRASG
jgi:hypothetical protein